MKAHVNEQAITVSVGQFIRELRNGKKKPSMFNILKSNGVYSSVRARSLVTRMIENKIICKHRDGSYSLTHENYDMKEVMQVLLYVPRKKPVRKPKDSAIMVIEEEVNPLETFHAQELVNELRNRGYVVTCAREVITIETL